MENPTNIVVTRTGHASRPDPDLAKLPLNSFIGKFVKKAFDVKIDGIPTREHMWVRVTDTANGNLIGILNNDPICETTLRIDDEVTVAPGEIEDVC